MFIRDLSKTAKFAAGDNSVLKELFNPNKDKLKINYSLALAKVKPGQSTKKHSLKSSEVYFILKGQGLMTIDNEQAEVKEGQAIYIPPNASQCIKNTGQTGLEFLCIVEPAWKPEDENVLE